MVSWVTADAAAPGVQDGSGRPPSEWHDALADALGAEGADGAAAEVDVVEAAGGKSTATSGSPFRAEAGAPPSQGKRWVLRRSRGPYGPFTHDRKPSVKAVKLSGFRQAIRPFVVRWVA